MTQKMDKESFFMGARVGSEMISAVMLDAADAIRGNAPEISALLERLVRQGRNNTADFIELMAAGPEHRLRRYTTPTATSSGEAR